MQKTLLPCMPTSEDRSTIHSVHIDTTLPLGISGNSSELTPSFTLTVSGRGETAIINLNSLIRDEWASRGWSERLNQYLTAMLPSSKPGELIALQILVRSLFRGFTTEYARSLKDGLQKWVR